MIHQLIPLDVGLCKTVNTVNQNIIIVICFSKFSNNNVVFGFTRTLFWDTENYGDI